MTTETFSMISTVHSCGLYTLLAKSSVNTNEESLGSGVPTLDILLLHLYILFPKVHVEDIDGTVDVRVLYG